MKHPLGIPWLASLLIAAVLFGAAWLVFADALDAEREKAMARVGGIPTAVSLERFQPAANIGPAGEVHVFGRIEVGEDGGGGAGAAGQLSPADSRTGRSYVAMFGPNDAPESRIARAAIAFGEGPADAAAVRLMEQIEGFATSGGVFSMNGRADLSPDVVAEAAAALAARGLSTAPDFVVIEPWNGSRDAAIASRSGFALMPAIGFAAAGLLAILLAVFDLRAGARRKAMLAGLPSWERAKLEEREGEEARINRNRTIFRRAILALGAFAFLAVLALRPEWAGPALFAGMVPLIVYVVLVMTGGRTAPAADVEVVAAAPQPDPAAGSEDSVLARHSSARLRPHAARLAPAADPTGPEAGLEADPDATPEIATAEAEHTTEPPTEAPDEAPDGAPDGAPESEEPVEPAAAPPEKPPPRPLTTLDDLKRDDAAPATARPKDRPQVSLGSALSQRRAQLKRPAAPPPLPRPTEPDDD